MTISEITRVVETLERTQAPTNSAAIARALGEHEYVVRTALHAARAAGYLQNAYRRDLPFGERDIYITTFNGTQAVKEMATS